MDSGKFVNDGADYLRVCTKVCVPGAVRAVWVHCWVQVLGPITWGLTLFWIRSLFDENNKASLNYKIYATLLANKN